jgi:hypothetical protein
MNLERIVDIVIEAHTRRDSRHRTKRGVTGGVAFVEERTSETLFINRLLAKGNG